MSHSVVQKPAIIIRRNVTRVAVAAVTRRVTVAAPARSVTAHEQVARTVVTHRGPPGRNGVDGETTPVEIVSHETIVAGQAIRVRTTTGKGSPAQANAISTADVFGFATNSVDADNTIVVTRDRVTVEDWTDIAGTEFLTPGQLYFLSTSVAGGIQTTPPTTAGHVVCALGEAVSPTTLAVQVGIPILL